MCHLKPHTNGTQFPGNLQFSLSISACYRVRRKGDIHNRTYSDRNVNSRRISNGLCLKTSNLYPSFLRLSNAISTAVICSDPFESEWSGSKGKFTPSTKITIWRQERCGAPVSIYGTCTKLGRSRSSLILLSHDYRWHYVQSRVYIQAGTYTPYFLNFLFGPSPLRTYLLLLY